MLLASKLYGNGLLSVGQAAQTTGLSKRIFMELLGHYQVSVLIILPKTSCRILKMPKIVSNTSCLILLDNINALYILQKLYQNIYLTEEEAQE